MWVKRMVAVTLILFTVVMLYTVFSGTVSV
jgi:hypothetical protein